MNEINIEHINRLSDIELSKLLHTLLRTEASQKSLDNLSNDLKSLGITSVFNEKTIIL